MIYGFVSVTTKYQNSENQEKLIRKAYPENDLQIVKSALGDSMAFSSLLSNLQEGDIVVVTDILHLTENETNFDTINSCYQRIFATGADIEVLNAPYVNSSIYRAAIKSNHMNGSSSVEMAVSMILEDQLRTLIDQSINNKKKLTDLIKDGQMNSPKHMGNKKGSKYRIKNKDSRLEYMQTHLQDFGGDQTNDEVMKALNMARNTFFRYKRELLSSSQHKSITAQTVSKSKKIKKTKFDTDSLKSDSAQELGLGDTSKTKRDPDEVVADSYSKAELPQDKAHGTIKENGRKKGLDGEKPKKKSKMSVDNDNIDGQTSLFDFL